MTIKSVFSNTWAWILVVITGAIGSLVASVIFEGRLPRWLMKPQDEAAPIALVIDWWRLGGIVGVISLVAIVVIVILMKNGSDEIESTPIQTQERPEDKKLQEILEKLTAPSPVLQMQRSQIGKYIVELQRIIGGLSAGVSNCVSSFYTLDSQIKAYLKREIPSFTDYGAKPLPPNSFKVRYSQEELTAIIPICEDRMNSLKSLKEFLG